MCEIKYKQAHFFGHAEAGMWSYLSFCEAEAVRELLPLCSNHVVVFFKRVLEPEQLRRRKRRADPFGLPGERVVQKETLRTRFVSCNNARKNDGFQRINTILLFVSLLGVSITIRPSNRPFKIHTVN